MEASGDFWQVRAIENLSVCSLGRIVWEETGESGPLKNAQRDIDVFGLSLHCPALDGSPGLYRSSQGTGITDGMSEKRHTPS